MVVIAVIVIGYIRFFYKELFVLSFDAEYSKVSGINSRYIQMFFMIITALVIGASMRIVGILLVSSLMTVPVAAAMQLAKSFKGAMIYSIVFGEMAVLIGLISAFYLDIAPGGTIVVTSIVFYWLFSLGKKYVERTKCSCREGGIRMTLDEAWRILHAKGLMQTGRLLKIFVDLNDKPGALKKIVDEISKASVNIVEVEHDRLSSNIPLVHAGVYLSLELENKNQANTLLDLFRKEKINFEIIPLRLKVLHLLYVSQKI